MAYPRDFLRVSFGGSTAGGQEIWSCSFAIAPNNNLMSPTDVWNKADTLSVGLLILLETMFSEPGMQIPLDVKLQWLKVAHIGTDGKYIEEPIELEASGEGANTNPYIPQAALVITTQSDKWKDPGKYNRFYLPIAQGSTDNTWCLSSVEQQTISEYMAYFFGEVNALDGSIIDTDKLFVSVASNSGSGSLRVVQNVRVGRLIDTQRRRRNALSEEYFDSPVPQE